MMADDNARETELVEKIEVETQLEGKSVTARKKSLGGLDSAVVLSGPRQRKKAELFQVEVKEKSEFVIKSGNGTKLGSIPNVHYQLGKLRPDDELLTSLHALFYKRAGVSHRRKRNIYEFSGFTFDDGEKAKEIEKSQERLGKWTLALLNEALDVFDLPRGNGEEGKKEAKIERLLKFMDEPKKMSDKDFAAQAAKKKEAARAKKEKEVRSSTPKSTTKPGRKSEGGQSTKKGAKQTESEEQAAEEEVEDEISEEEQAVEPEEQPQKRAKKESTGSAKKTTKKRAKSRKTTGKKRKADEEDIAEPVSAETAVILFDPDFPSDDEIKAATLGLLQVSDVNKTTVNDLLKELNKKFDKNLSRKKPLVKMVAVDYAQSKAAIDEKAGDDDEVAADAPPAAKKQKKGEDEDADKEEAVSTADVMVVEEASNSTAEEAKAEPAVEPEAKDAMDTEPGAADVKPEAQAEEVKEQQAEAKEEVSELKEPAADTMEADELKDSAAAGVSVAAVGDNGQPSKSADLELE